MIQWWRLCASTAGGAGLIPGLGTKISNTTQCSQKTKAKNQTTRHHFTPRRMTVIKKKKMSKNKCWQGYGQTGTLVTLLVKTWNGASTVGNNLAASPKIKHIVIVRSSNSTPRYVGERNKSICLYRILYTHVPSSIIHNGQKVRTAFMCTNWWMDN